MHSKPAHLAENLVSSGLMHLEEFIFFYGMEAPSD